MFFLDTRFAVYIEKLESVSVEYALWFYAEIEHMNKTLQLLKTKVYDPCGLEISDFQIAAESKEYDACSFQLNGRGILNRNAKVTPKKVGQFVTFWKRNGTGPIAPFCETDPIDFYVVQVHTKTQLGQFVFPKTILIKKGIITTATKEGKRAFRVYPSWDIVQNKQAQRTQKWQLDYFYKINDAIHFDKVKALYQIT